MGTILKYLSLLTFIQIMGQVLAWWLASAHGYQWGTENYGRITGGASGVSLMLWCVLAAGHALASDAKRYR